RLKNAQRRIARNILALVPPEDSAHGFRRGRSIVSHAKVHADQRVVMRMDLAEFFPSISGARVAALFHAIGYPERVAGLLAALTTNAVPNEVLDDAPRRDLDRWPRM